jgi:hypothetical protein
MPQCAPLTTEYSSPSLTARVKILLPVPMKIHPL